MKICWLLVASVVNLQGMYFAVVQVQTSKSLNLDGISLYMLDSESQPENFEVPWGQSSCKEQIQRTSYDDTCILKPMTMDLRLALASGKSMDFLFDCS